VTRYLDSSALVKLFIDEPESEALRQFMHGETGNAATSSLARTEVARAVASQGDDLLRTARRFLGACSEIALTRNLLDRAGELAHELGLRSLDAIHLATADQVRPFLRVIVTYDQRMAEGARRFGFEVVMPGVA
jgi:predicted nucleic acid-binding protein